MRILKFGGTSVGSPKKINNVIEIVQTIIKEHGKAAVVVSAMEGTTDDLQHMASLASRGREEFREILERLKTHHVDCVNELIPADQRSAVLANVQVLINDLEDALQGVFLVWEISDRILDYILSFGEQLSAYIISAAMAAQGFPAEYLDAREIISTDDHFGSANVDFDSTNEKIRAYFEEHNHTQVITGFIGATPIGETATLGRGGSDYSAAILAAALDADAIEIWTDVDGIMTADPRQVRRAFPIEKISYHEAMELSHFGARVIHPPTLQPARARSIPIVVRNSLNPSFAGTMIKEAVEPGKYPATGISAIDNVNLLRIQGSGMVGVAGVSSRLFGVLAQHGINVILITQASSEHSICFAVTPGNANLARRVIEEEFKHELASRQIDDVVVESDRAIVSVVGDNMCQTPGVAGKIFQTLGRNNINLIAIAQGSTERNISFVVARNDRTKALNVIHDEFFLPTLRSLEVVVVGAGNVGGELIDQMKDQQSDLSENFGIHLNVVGIANSRKYLFEPRGIVLDNWRELLEKSGTEYEEVHDLIEETEVLDLSSIVFVDCTASEALSTQYQHLLERGISVVTANKKGQTGALESYQGLKKHFKTRGVKFLYEASVGAGLPILSTLRSLLASGDEIVRIEGVVSGTLSYIFNSFAPGRSFSEIVKEAQELGYTEPDPREDLNGMDVARKLLILGRECGIDLELEDIELQPLLNEECLNASSIEDFYKKLEGMDSEFEQKISEASSRGSKLCYRALLENGKAQVLLSEVDQDHPLFSLSGSDNMFIFQTKRYFSRPLVVRGPGAGGAVTAAGVFADVISTAEKLAIV